MKKYFVAVAVAIAGCAHSSTGGVSLSEPLKAPESLNVTSSTFAEGGALAPEFSFNGFGCTGANTRPQLAWSNAPADTKSFAIIVHDPDAPTGVGFFHWVVLDIPAETTALASDTELTAPAIVARNDAGTNSYVGPCPPPGPAHRYIFTVYALDVTSLGLGDSATGALARFAMGSHVLAYGRTTATYGR
jgi:Raf kinase inhibitor-like YbhB/YbcL family protein